MIKMSVQPGTQDKATGCFPNDCMFRQKRPVLWKIALGATDWHIPAQDESPEIFESNTDGP